MKISMNGRAKVKTHHDLYGSQTIISENVYFFHTDKKVGISIGGYELYLYPEEVKEIQASEDFIRIVGDLQTITAKPL